MFLIDDIVSSFFDNSFKNDRQERGNEFNAMQAQMNRDFQERMQREQWQRDDNAYQRTVEDMAKAGLNPLSGSTSPSSGPLSISGDSASSVSVSSPGFGGFDSNLVNALIKKEELDLQNKRLNLDALTEGVDPNVLDEDSDKSKVVDLFSRLVDAEARSREKEANSPYVRGEGEISQGLKDIKGVIKDLGLTSDNIPKPKKSLTGSPYIINKGKPAVTAPMSEKDFNPNYKKTSAKQKVSRSFRKFINGVK